MRHKAVLRNTGLVVAVTILSLSLATFATAATSQTEIKWMEWWVHEWGPNNMTALIDAFEKANPNIKVDVVDTPYPEMPTKLNAAAAAGENYDVFGTEGSWLIGLKKLGYVENLDPWLAKDKPFAQTLLPMTLRKINGDTLSFCLYLIPYQFAYNVDFFQQAHLTPPTSWDQFVKVEKTMHTSSQRFGMSLTFGDGGFVATRYFGFRLAQEGGQFMDKNGHITLNNAAGVRAVNWWKSFYDMGLAVPGSFGEDQTRMLEYLASGQVNSIIDGPFIWTKAKQIDPNIKIAYAPPWHARTGGYLWSCSGVAMSSKSPNKDAAWTFLKYLYSQPVSIMMTKAVSLPWADKSAMDSLKGSSDPMLRYAWQMASQDSQANITLPILPATGGLFDSFKGDWQDMMSGKETAQQGLNKIAAAWQAAIDQSK
jgi:multiple sugar transport system substrate-binding protein